MKVQPPTITEVAIIGGLCVAGYLVYTAYKAASEITTDKVVAAASDFVDQRKDPQSTLGQSQDWFSNTVQKGQDAGASTFVTSFFTGLFK